MQAANPQTSNGPAPVLHRGIVKQVLSGDLLIIRGPPKGGPPPEKQICLSNIIAPKLARRPIEDQTEGSKDEPFAWEAREFLRNLVIGQEVTFEVDYKPSPTREYGRLWVGTSIEGDSIAELMVAEGLVEVRQASNRPNNDYLLKLDELQKSAQAAGKGKWGSDTHSHIRDIKWTQENPRNLVDSLKQEPQKAVIEHVRDGSTVRAFLLPSFDYVTVMLSGLRCPGFKLGEGGKIIDPEPFALQAKFFTEARLLQRDVEIVLESVSNFNYLGSVIHPRGDISEALLSEGFAKCVDWSMAVVSGGPEKLRAAEKKAKEARLRVWTDYTTPLVDPNAGDKTFHAKVVEIGGMSDSMVVKKPNGDMKKIFLSSIRPPRSDDFAHIMPNLKDPSKRIKPLYDIPFMFEAREFLRKKLIGKKVQVTVDYVQAASDNFPEKTCCTVVIGGQNLAEALVAKGLCTVVRYRQGEENRSLAYDQLLAAEEKAKKSRLRIHSLRSDNAENNDKAPSHSKDKDPPIIRVQELQGDYGKSKQFLPYLQRAGRSEGIVEFVASGSRMRVFVPKETCLITLLLSGINSPRGSRTQGNQTTPAEPFGDEAAMFTKEFCMHHEIQFEVETMDKAGNFVGYVFKDNVNLAVALCEAGLADVHFTAERGNYFSQLTEAVESAKLKKLCIWQNYEEPKEEDKEKEDKVKERAVSHERIVVTEVVDYQKFFGQHISQGPKLEQMMVELRTQFQSDPPMPGAYSPKRGEICAARFSEDQLWYRAKVETIKSAHHVEVHFIDFGNREVTSVTALAALPPAFATVPSGAHDFSLAFVLPHEDPDNAESASEAFQQEAMRYPELLMNVEYRAGGTQFVTLHTPDGIDITKKLIEEGFLMVEQRREIRFQSLLDDYKKGEETAKKQRYNIWRYGDFTGTDL